MRRQWGKFAIGHRHAINTLHARLSESSTEVTQDPLMWPDRMVNSLEDAVKERLARFLTRSIVLTTAYSGMGAFEYTLKSFATEMALPSKFVVYSACDNDDTCINVLLAHEGISAPQHVNVDITERWGRRVPAALRALQRSFNLQVNALIVHGDRSRSAAVNEVGTTMLDAMDAIMRNASMRTHQMPPLQ